MYLAQFDKCINAVHMTAKKGHIQLDYDARYAD